MAILHRFGSADDFDPNKMQSRELAYVNTTNTSYKAGLYLCYAPGDVRRQTTEQDIQNMLNSSPGTYSALQQLLADLESNPSELTNILNNILVLQLEKLDKIGDTKDNTTTFAEALTDADIISGENHATKFGKILKSIKTFRTTLSNKIDKLSIAQTTEVNDATKVPSTVVTNTLASLINSLTTSVTVINNNLGQFKMYDTVDSSASGVMTISLSKGLLNARSYLLIIHVPNASDSAYTPAIYVLTRQGANLMATPILSSTKITSITFVGTVPNINFTANTYPKIVSYQLN